ncbi:MAG: two-component system response regulator [Pedosphaera sp.]|nr:two-component system response regulator [Pedosphaera sp.]
MNVTARTILLVEDNEDDVFFMEQAKGRAGIQNPMQVAHNGQEAIDYLQGAGKYTDRSQFPLPFLILLDLKLPLVMGLDVLKWIRERPEFETVLVVVLTSSREDRDIDTAYRIGANSYLVKPPTAQKLTELVKCLGDYWIRQNEPPVHIGEAVH